MGYLIESTILKKEVVISAANLVVVNSIPAQIINSNELTDYTILAANLSCVDKLGGNVSSFGHFYLQFGVTPGSEKSAIYDENIGPITTTKTCYFIINMSHPPNRFGAVYQYSQDLTLSSEFAPTTNTDLIVTVYYFKNF